MIDKKIMHDIIEEDFDKEKNLKIILKSCKNKKNEKQITYMPILAIAVLIGLISLPLYVLHDDKPKIEITDKDIVVNLIESEPEINLKCFDENIQSDKIVTENIMRDNIEGEQRVFKDLDHNKVVELIGHQSVFYDIDAKQLFDIEDYAYVPKEAYSINFKYGDNSSITVRCSSLNDYNKYIFVKDGMKESFIDGIKTTIYKYGNIYVAYFDKNALHYELEIKDTKYQDLADILEYIVK